MRVALSIDDRNLPRVLGIVLTALVILSLSVFIGVSTGFADDDDDDDDCDDDDGPPICVTTTTTTPPTTTLPPTTTEPPVTTTTTEPPVQDRRVTYEVLLRGGERFRGQLSKVGNRSFLGQVARFDLPDGTWRSVHAIDFESATPG